MPRILDIGPLAAADVTSGTSSVSGLTVTPSGRVGDLWVAFYATVGGNCAHSPPAGDSWQLVADTGNIASVLRITAWAKRAVVANGIPYNFTHDTATRRAVLSIRAFSNVLQVEGTPQTGGAGGQTSFTHAAQTALGPERLWLAITAKDTAGGGSSVMNAPSGFAETTDLVSAHGTNANANLGVHHKIVPAGSTGTQLVNSDDGGSNAWAGIGILLKPRSMRLPR